MRREVENGEKDLGDRSVDWWRRRDRRGPGKTTFATLRQIIDL